MSKYTALFDICRRSRDVLLIGFSKDTTIAKFIRANLDFNTSTLVVLKRKRGDVVGIHDLQLDGSVQFDVIYIDNEDACTTPRRLSEDLYCSRNVANASSHVLVIGSTDDIVVGNFVNMMLRLRVLSTRASIPTAGLFIGELASTTATLRIGLSICRFRRDPTSWLLSVCDGVLRFFDSHIHFCDKSGCTQGAAETRCAALRQHVNGTTVRITSSASPNVGKDQHAHIKYIVDHYDDLPEVVLFLQDDILEHRDVLLRADDVSDECAFVAQLLSHTLDVGYSRNARSYIELTGPSFAPTYGFKVNCGVYTHEHDSGLTFGQWFERFLGEAFPRSSPVLWFKNAIFAVRREHILSRPKSTYVSILHSQFPTTSNEADHFMERTWFYMLGLHRRQPNALRRSLPL